MPEQPFREEDVIGTMKYPDGDDLTIVKEDDDLRMHMHDAGGWYSRGFCTEDVAELLRQLAEKDDELSRLRESHIWACHEVEQILGKALGYPWYKDDQKNFPGTTEADGVCFGEHVPETLAQEAAQKIRTLRRLLRTICPYKYSDTFNQPPTDEVRKALWKEIREALK